MSTMIEEIRKRIKAASDNTDEAGHYDEYESGQGVGLATALQIIDEVVKEHPVPADVQEDADKVDLDDEIERWWNEWYAKMDKNYKFDSTRGHYLGNETIIDFARHFHAAGMLAERERLASCPTIKGWVARDGHGSLVFSNEKPSRLEWCGWKLWKISRGTPAVVLPDTLSDLRWEDEPREVEIIIKEAKK